jgi:hypothetical protein
VRAHGAEVPPFELAVTAPFAPKLTEPSTFVGLTVDRTVPFVLRWEAPPPGATGHVFLWLSDIECMVPVEAGELRVAPELLASLPQSNQKLGVVAWEESVLFVDGWRLRAAAYGPLPMLDPNEGSFGEVTVE